jgi:hypothetical protein
MTISNFMTADYKLDVPITFTLGSVTNPASTSPVNGLDI